MALKSSNILLLLSFGLLWRWTSSMPTHSGVGCAYEYNHILCRYEVYCNQRIQISFYQSFRNHDYCPHVSYKGQNFDHIYVFMREYYIKNEVDDSGNENLLLSDMEGSANIVFSIDFSDNQLMSMPVLTRMGHLRIFNISHNVLTKARLSNKHEVEELEEIDFSYNTVNSIEVNNHEYVFRKLKKINLSNNYIVSITDAIFDSFPELQVLDLSYNFIDSLNILTFEGAKTIMTLDLKHNRLSELDSSLLRFNQLTKLDLSQNKIVSIKFSDFYKLSRLATLDISSNLIQDIESNAFSNMDLLGFLDLSNNVLEHVDKYTFANLTKLESINLSKNHFKGLPRDILKGRNIKVFSIKDNKLEGALIKGTFEGLKLVKELDLSYQQLTVVEDYAFFSLDSLNTLLLDHNRLNTISNNAFGTLRNLEILDLSNNELTSIDFRKDDLISLRSLLLQKNKLVQIKHEYFNGFNTLQFLDLSSNNISRLEINSFHSLRDLINIQISNNPIAGTLEESTFDGLNSLPSLDISSTLLTTIKNSSFNNMNHLKDLNMSHSKISEIQYNSLLNTGSIQTIDLSFNQLTEFHVNTTDLRNLVNLVLNHNLLTNVAQSFFKGLPCLLKIIISNNKIETIANNAFQDQKDIRHLDLAYNTKLKFNISQLETAPNLNTLILAGIRSNIDFSGIKVMWVSNLDMSNSEISNVTSLGLKSLKYVDSLGLSHNNITTVDAGAFNGAEKLRNLDLSFNMIISIQPGAFKENTILQSLNISHNSLKVVSYGIFRGLAYLQAIDMSFNELSDLETERFYEVPSLSTLIVDHNKITNVNIDEFAGTSLSSLSIGGNPLPCDILVNFKKNDDSPFTITAIKLDENSPDENVDGVTCNMGEKRSPKSKHGDTVSGNENILLDIKNILHNLSLDTRPAAPLPVPDNNSKYLFNVSRKIELGNANTSILLQNLTSTFELGNTYTNTLLDKIFKVLTSMSAVRKVPTPVAKENVTNDNFVSYIGKVKQELEDTIAFEKQNILNAVDARLDQIVLHKDTTTAEGTPNKEAYKADISDSKSFLFIEICVGSILIILVLFIVYKFYNSGMFVPMRPTSSTRQLADDMENSAL